MARAKGPFDAVQFTKESAERVARVVRRAETTPSAGAPLIFDKRFTDKVPKQVRAATFSGSWAINSNKVVTFKYAPTATQTVTNLSWPITHNHSTPENCIVGKEGTSWWLVVPVLQTATAVFVTQTQSLSFLTGVSASGSINTANCSISIFLSTSSATAVVISSSYTSAFLRMRTP
jgi:hypothetical protein